MSLEVQALVDVSVTDTQLSIEQVITALLALSPESPSALVALFAIALEPY